jgi:hypothetical protein
VFQEVLFEARLPMDPGDFFSVKLGHPYSERLSRGTARALFVLLFCSKLGLKCLSWGDIDGTVDTNMGTNKKEATGSIL